MKRSLLLMFFGLLTINLLCAQTVVNLSLAPSTPQLTAVDPYANAANSADGLKPARPFWYSVDQKGLTILRIDDNTVVYHIPWPATISVVQPSGEYVEVPAPASGWEPVAMTVTYPTEEALASNSETPPTFVYVVMAHSGFEWQSNPNPPAGQDPNLRDTLVPASSPATESSMLVSVDVTDPTFDPAENPTGPIIAAAILGHGAGQPAYDPSTDLLYVGNLPSTSLPTGLQSFVSVIAAMAPPVAEPAGAGPPVPEAPLVNLCGPEHPDEGLLVGEPYVWACTESGDGPAIWEFQNLPPWLMTHPDKISGALDGLVYGTPTADGTWMFQARVTDYGDPEMGPLTSDWYTVTVNVIPTGVASEAEAGFEAGIPGGQGIGGTGDCTPAVTSTPGSMVPTWIDVQPALVNGVVKGCYVMGTAPISGEFYEFALPNFHFNAPFNYEPVILSGNVAGPYVFDPLPAGVSLSGLAWHQIEKIHDPSTEADILNVEFIGVEPTTGQLYRILPPQGTIETGGQVSPPEISVETDKITPEEPYTWSLTGRLPSGLRLSRTGLISGRAGNNSAGNYTFTVRVTDSAAQSASKSLTLTINARPRR
jgi:Putative Ig domain